MTEPIRLENAEMMLVVFAPPAPSIPPAPLPFPTSSSTSASMPVSSSSSSPLLLTIPSGFLGSTVSAYADRGHGSQGPGHGSVFSSEQASSSSGFLLPPNIPVYSIPGGMTNDLPNDPGPHFVEAPTFPVEPTSDRDESRDAVENLVTLEKTAASMAAFASPTSARSSSPSSEPAFVAAAHASSLDHDYEGVVAGSRSGSFIPPDPLKAPSSGWDPSPFESPSFAAENKRPPNCFLLWLRDNRRTLTQHPAFASKSHAQRTRLWSAIWKRLPPEAKAPYEEESKRRRMLYQRRRETTSTKPDSSLTSTSSKPFLVDYNNNQTDAEKPAKQLVSGIQANACPEMNGTHCNNDNHAASVQTANNAVVVVTVDDSSRLNFGDPVFSTASSSNEAGVTTYWNLSDAAVPREAPPRQPGSNVVVQTYESVTDKVPFIAPSAIEPTTRPLSSGPACSVPDLKRTPKTVRDLIRRREAALRRVAVIERELTREREVLRKIERQLLECQKDVVGSEDMIATHGHVATDCSRNY